MKRGAYKEHQKWKDARSKQQEQIKILSFCGCLQSTFLKILSGNSDLFIWIFFKFLFHLSRIYLISWRYYLTITACSVHHVSQSCKTNGKLHMYMDQMSLWRSLKFTLCILLLKCVVGTLPSNQEIPHFGIHPHFN